MYEKLRNNVFLTFLHLFQQSIPYKANELQAENDAKFCQSICLSYLCKAVWCIGDIALLFFFFMPSTYKSFYRGQKFAQKRYNSVTNSNVRLGINKKNRYNLIKI